MKTKKLIYFILALLLAGVLFFIFSSFFTFRNTFYSYQDAIRLKIHKEYRDLFINESNDYYFENADIVDTLNIPTYELIFSDTDNFHFKYLYEQYELGFNSVEYTEEGKANYTRLNKYRRAQLVVNKDTFNVKIRSHGSQPDRDRIGEYISFRIKLLDGRQLYNCTKFKLLIYDCMKHKSKVIDYLADEFSLIRSKQNELIKLKITGKKPKLYFFEHLTNNKIMEAQGLSSFRINKAKYFNDKSCVSARNNDTTYLNTAIDSAFADEDFQENITQGLKNRYNNLNRDIKLQNSAKALDYFTLEYASSYLASRYIGNFNGHEQFQGNSIIYLDYASGKFFPTLNREPFLHGSIKDRTKIEEHFLKGRHKVKRNVDGKLHLVSFLTNNDFIRIKAYRKAYNFLVKNGKDYVKLYKKGLDFDELLYPDNLIYSLLAKSILEDEFVVEQNFEKLKSYLTEANPEYTYEYKENSLFLYIKPNSFSPLKLNNTLINYLVDSLAVDSVILSNSVSEYETLISNNNAIHGIRGELQNLLLFNGIAENFGSDNKIYKIEIPILENTNIESIVKRIGLYHDFTKKETKINLATENYSELHFGKHKVIEKKWPLPFVKFSDSLVLKSGKYYLSENLILPQNNSLTLEPGVSIYLDSSISFLTQGSLYINGTKNNPVTIKPKIENHKYGTFAALGSNNTRCSINYLNLSGGTEAILNGAYYSGQFSIHYYSEVKILNSIIANSGADDGLNIKYCNEIRIAGSRFVNNFADHIDLDFCIGDVTHCSFSNNNVSDYNGDGIDASGSKLTIK